MSTVTVRACKPAHCGISSQIRQTRYLMINFEEELKNFRPSLEVEEAEQAIYNHEQTDMADVLQEMLREMKRGM